MSPRMLQQRRNAAARRVETGTPPALPGALRREYTLIAVDDTPVELGLANRRRDERARRLRRLARALGMPLLTSLAVAGGVAVGHLGDRPPRVRPIAPTTLPVFAPSAPVSELPLAPIPAPRTGR